LGLAPGTHSVRLPTEYPSFDKILTVSVTVWYQGQAANDIDDQCNDVDDVTAEYKARPACVQQQAESLAATRTQAYGGEAEAVRSQA